MERVNLKKALYKGYTVWAAGVVTNPRGKVVGWKRADGYVFIFITGKSGTVRWRLHRLMWHVLVHPITKDVVVDHKDGRPSNNRISNLRACTRSENQYKRRAKLGNTAGGLKGVYKRTTRTSGDRYIASYSENGNVVYAGSYLTPEEAHAAYRQAVADKHGEFSDLNR